MLYFDLSLVCYVFVLFCLYMCLGGWPLVGIDSDNPWDINDMEGYVSEKLYGSTAFFVLEVLADDKNTSRNIFYVGSLTCTLMPTLYCICLTDTAHEVV